MMCVCLHGASSWLPTTICNISAFKPFSPPTTTHVYLLPCQDADFHCLCIILSQVWDSTTGRLKKDLSYQAEEMFMMHEEAVLALGYSRDSEMLVSGESCRVIEDEKGGGGKGVICSRRFYPCMKESL